jgi:hypothetical protein
VGRWNADTPVREIPISDDRGTGVLARAPLIDVSGLDLAPIRTAAHEPTHAPWQAEFQAHLWHTCFGCEQCWRESAESAG